MRFEATTKTLAVLVTAAFGLSTVFCCGGPEAAYGPDDKVTIKGRFLDETGRALKGREIAVWIDNIELFFFVPDFTTSSDSKGYFSITEQGKHFIWGSGRTKYTTVANISSNDGPVTSMGFYPIEAIIELPEARLWSAKLNERVKRGKATFEWNTVDYITGQPADEYEFEARCDSDWYLWYEDEVESGLSLPAYIFQNRCTGWRVSAELESDDSYGIDWSYRSETRIGKNLLPDKDYKLLSAGKPCYAEGQSTRITSFTNLEWNDSRSLDSLTSWLMLDLEAVKEISAVAVYDLGVAYYESPYAFESFQIFVAKDTSRWGEPVAQTSQEEGYMHFEFTPVKGRYVKLEGNPGSNVSLSSLVEFAAFGPAR
ncbi:discoidin domain-containing protein [candidate division WOR-3 bacterium]|nr:discoidin domain-containing protein [candidate division WOR-3 bacterium]